MVVPGFRSFFSCRRSVAALSAASIVAILLLCALCHKLVPAAGPVYAASEPQRTLLPVSIDYPESGSIFPPGITPPTFLWRDAAGSSWSIDISFADGSQPIHAASTGERMQLGEIDPQTVSDSNQPPRLNAQ